MWLFRSSAFASSIWECNQLKNFSASGLHNCSRNVSWWHRQWWNITPKDSFWIQTCTSVFPWWRRALASFMIAMNTSNDGAHWLPTTRVMISWAALLVFSWHWTLSRSLMVVPSDTAVKWIHSGSQWGQHMSHDLKCNNQCNLEYCWCNVVSKLVTYN